MARIEPDDAMSEAARLLARAQADADAIRRDALVTAEGIRQIALEDARTLSLPGTTPPTQAGAGEGPSLAELLERVERLERKLKRQRRQIERLEAVLLGLAPGLSPGYERRRKKR
jgi:DNA invertase Pin-like site-specific DNA recombinase